MHTTELKGQEAQPHQSPSNSLMLLLVRGYPRLSETFIGYEILAAARTLPNCAIATLGMKRQHSVHQVHRDIDIPAYHLSRNFFKTAILALLGQRRLPLEKSLWTMWKQILQEDSPIPYLKRIECFLQAIELVTTFGEKVRHIHSFFLTETAIVAMYAARLLDVKWTCSCHAKDIYAQPRAQIEALTESASWLATCTEFNKRYLEESFTLQETRMKVTFVPHGIDLDLFTPRSMNETSKHSEAVSIVSVGRAMPKKGYDTLIKALLRLPIDLQWHFLHVGPGDFVLQKLLQEIDRSGSMTERIEFTGAVSQDVVASHLQNADIFCLPCRVLANGDRDGRPNAVLEAQATGLPCIVGNVSALPELVTTEETGLIVPADDDAALAEALERLIRDPQLRQRLGRNARKKAEIEYDTHKNGVAFAQLLAATMEN